MSENTQHSLLASKGLSTERLEEIEQLAEVCNQHDGLDLKLNWGVLRTRPQDATSDFLYYEDGKLVGYLALFSFNSYEGELSGMVHPVYRRKGIFTRLLEAARNEYQQRGIASILLIVEQASESGQAFVKHLPHSYDHTEHKMTLQESRVPGQFEKPIEFRRAKPDEATVLAHITALSFGMPEHEVNWYFDNVGSLNDRWYYVGVVDGVVVGKIDISLDEHEAIIYGFGVLPEYQRRGYGRQMLARSVQEILKTGQNHIALEVVTTNQHALSLYQSCGFVVTSSYDYYQLAR